MSVIRTTTIAAAAVGLAAAGLAMAPAASAGSNPVVIGCLGKGQVKPKQIVMACADFNLYVGKITWSSWGGSTATGKGTLVWNTCVPTDCASGTFLQYPAKITLNKVKSEGGQQVFTGMTLTFGNFGGPAGADSSTFTLDNTAF